MTTARVLTPPGRGAIAVVAVEGPSATEAVDKCFHAANGRPLADQPIGAIRFGRWGDERGEELLVVRRDRDSVEIHCHGGVAASGAILRALDGEGLTTAEGDSLGQAALGGDPLSSYAREAWAALPRATTERVAAVLLDQAGGALDRAIAEIDAAIAAGDNAAAIESIDRLLAWRTLGERLLEPTRVVLVGPPNAGKSSLINALVGYDRAIVHDRPGTTRDVVTATTAVRGWPIRLADTAGIREAADPIEAAGVRLARETLAAADVVVAVAEDGAAVPLAIDLPHGVPTIRVASKADLHPSDTAGAIATSVVTGQGVEELVGAIAEAIAPEQPALGDAIPFRSEHYRWLASRRRALT